MDTKLIKAKYDFEKDFFKLMSNSIFWKDSGKCNKQQRY